MYHFINLNSNLKRSKFTLFHWKKKFKNITYDFFPSMIFIPFFHLNLKKCMISSLKNILRLKFLELKL